MNYIQTRLCKDCGQSEPHVSFRPSRRICRICEHKKYYYKDLEHSRQVRRDMSYTAKTRFRQSKAKAKKRQLTFTLNLEEYSKLISYQCHYCEAAGIIEIIKESGVGLDRIDNSIGYELDNVLPCCGMHNCMRGDYLTVEETVACAKLVANMRAS